MFGWGIDLLLRQVLWMPDISAQGYINGICLSLTHQPKHCLQASWIERDLGNHEYLQLEPARSRAQSTIMILQSPISQTYDQKYVIKSMPSSWE